LSVVLLLKITIKLLHFSSFIHLKIKLIFSYHFHTNNRYVIIVSCKTMDVLISYILLGYILHLYNMHNIILLSTCRNFLIILSQGGCQDIIIIITVLRHLQRRGATVVTSTREMITTHIWQKTERINIFILLKKILLL
jgi:hypothetical protein